MPFSMPPPGCTLVVGFDLLGHSPALRHHWMRRILAFAADMVIVFLPLWLAMRYLGLAESLFLGLASGPALYGYSVAFEALSSRTPGKAMTGLEVRAQGTYLRPSQVAIRNVPKIFWYIFPAVDALLGLATEGDPRQRFMDRIVGTTVALAWSVEAREAAPAPKAKPPAVVGPPCGGCGGPLSPAGDDFLQCQRCGLIQ
jgi:hypothetical protein